MLVLIALMGCGEEPVETPEDKHLTVQWAEYECVSGGVILDLPEYSAVTSVAGCAYEDKVATCRTDYAYLMESYLGEERTQWVSCTGKSSHFRVEWVE